MKNILLGPFCDLKRFAAGVINPPPPTRVLTGEGVAAARETLTAAGCDLSRSIVNNLHTGLTTLPPEHLFDLVTKWQLWPCSSFFASPRHDNQGVEWFSYRWYKIIPIVVMKLKTMVKPRHIIYDLDWGIGAGGYHSFLFRQNSDGLTEFSIFTTFPPTILFMEGLHDQFNYDIYHNLKNRER